MYRKHIAGLLLATVVLALVVGENGALASNPLVSGPLDSLLPGKAKITREDTAAYSVKCAALEDCPDGLIIATWTARNCVGTPTYEVFPANETNVCLSTGASSSEKHYCSADNVPSDEHVSQLGCVLAQRRGVAHFFPHGLLRQRS